MGIVISGNWVKSEQSETEKFLRQLASDTTIKSYEVNKMYKEDLKDCFDIYYLGHKTIINDELPYGEIKINRKLKYF